MAGGLPDDQIIRQAAVVSGPPAPPTGRGVRHKPGHPGGGRIRGEIRGCGAVGGWGPGPVVVLGLPGLAGCGMMARAARDAGAPWEKSPYISLALGP
jgi:hypothetical protein